MRDFPADPKIDPPTITPLERFWVWINYFIQGEIIKGTKGEPIANPFALISATNRWKWMVAGIVVVVLVLMIGRWV